MTWWSAKKLVTLGLFTAIALTIFVAEAQIPVPLPIPGIKLGLANCITLIVLELYSWREAAVVLLLRILLGSLFAGTLVSLAYSICGGVLCFVGMTLLSSVVRKHLWFISLIGAVLHNIGQILAAIVIMQSVQVAVYLPFLTLAGCITGVFTGFAADAAVKAIKNTAIHAIRARVLAEEETEKNVENYNTGDAKLDNIRNQDGIGKQELLVLSFGTSYNDSRRLTIGAIEDTLEKAFPAFSVRRGFTSNVIIDHIQSRDGIRIDNVEAAVKRAIKNGVKTLVVQPTHLMHGLEYDELVEKVRKYVGAFEQVVFGEPLLSSDADFVKVEQAITSWTADYDDGKTAICFMGHGTEADANHVYAKMQAALRRDGYCNYYIGTVEATPDLEDVLTQVQMGEYTRVVLEPLMVVAGDHANHDMAGEDVDSWKSVFEKNGYETICLVRGLGENAEIRQIYVEHVAAAVGSPLSSPRRA